MSFFNRKRNNNRDIPRDSSNGLFSGSKRDSIQVGQTAHFLDSLGGSVVAYRRDENPDLVQVDFGDGNIQTIEIEEFDQMVDNGQLQQDGKIQSHLESERIKAEEE